MLTPKRAKLPISKKKKCICCNTLYLPRCNNQLYCDACREFLSHPPKKPHTEADIEEINRKASALGLSYGQMVQKYKL